jgi:Domain of unknown function (DUF4129)
VTRRVVPLALLVSALLAVVAIAAHGRPLGFGSRGGGPSSRFVDYVYTSIVVVVVLCGVVGLWWLLTNQPPLRTKPRPHRNLLVTLLYIAMCGLIGWGLVSSDFQRRFSRLERRLHLTDRKNQNAPPGQRSPHGSTGHGAQLRWDEVAIVLALLAAIGVVGYAARSRRPRPSWQAASQAAVSAALDESLDDLRSEPDLRKAIIAAYARMERALAMVGLPRLPAEAPLEYVERALAELDTSTGAIGRLTHLFEWAKFSQHEPEPSMRDEAIDALVAVRDELRAPAGEPVAA